MEGERTRGQLGIIGAHREAVSYTSKTRHTVWVPWVSALEGCSVYMQALSHLVEQIESIDVVLVQYQFYQLSTGVQVHRLQFSGLWGTRGGLVMWGYPLQVSPGQQGKLKEMCPWSLVSRSFFSHMHHVLTCRNYWKCSSKMSRQNTAFFWPKVDEMGVGKLSHNAWQPCPR